MGNSKKRSKGRSKSKAALETARRQSTSGSVGQFSAPSGSGGMMTRMRSGFQNAVGPDEESKSSPIQRILWTVVIVAAVFFFARGFQ